MWKQNEQGYSNAYNSGGAAPSAPPSYQEAINESPHDNLRHRFPQGVGGVAGGNEQGPNSRQSRLNAIVQKYEISELFARKLAQKLNSFKIVFIFDDSGSMSTRLDESPLNHGSYQATRWDELKYFAQIGLDIANIFNTEGTDVFFLNRPMARAVKSFNDLYPYLINEPSGYTPLASIFSAVLSSNPTQPMDERKLLVIVVTDGEPTDQQGRGDVDGFHRVLKSRPHNVYTTIVCCTDEHETMSYLNNWDRVLPRLDVVDDFKSERDEIRSVQGKSFSFTFGDYVIKCLLGSVDAQLDSLDERSVDPTDCSCIIL